MRNVPPHRVGEVVQSYVTRDEATRVLVVQTAPGLYEVIASDDDDATAPDADNAADPGTPSAAGKKSGGRRRTT